MRIHCISCFLAISIITAVTGCNRSPTPSSVRTPEATGTSGSAAAPADARPTDSTPDPFDQQIRDYLDQTRTLREQAAKSAAALTDKSNRPADAEAAVRARQAALAALIRTDVRPTAHQGDIFSSASGDAVRRRLAAAFSGSEREAVRHELQEQNDETKGHPD